MLSPMMRSFLCSVFGMGVKPSMGAAPGEPNGVEPGTTAVDCGPKTVNSLWILPVWRWDAQGFFSAFFRSPQDGVFLTVDRTMADRTMEGRTM